MTNHVHGAGPARRPGSKTDPSLGGRRMLDVLSLTPEKPQTGAWIGELGPITMAREDRPADPLALMDRLSLTRRP